MKYIIYILIFICLGLSVKAQVPTGFPSQRWAGWIEPTYVVPDSGAIITKRDTSFIPRFVGTTVTWQRPGIDTTFWFWNGAHWGRVTLAQLDTTSLSNRINLKLNISDTASMLSPYLRKIDTTNHWVQNVYARNDSLFKLKNGTETFVHIFPTSGSGTVTSVALSMPAAFTVSGSPITTSGTFNVSGAGTSAQYVKGNLTLGTTDTSMIPSFFTKVRSLFSGTSPITYNSFTGALGILNANTSGQKGAATFSSSNFTDNGTGLINLNVLGSAGSCTGCVLNITAEGRISGYSDGPSGATNNVNLGSGFRILNAATQEIRTIFSGFGIRIDSVTNTNGLTWKADTARITGLPTYYYVDSSVNGNGGRKDSSQFSVHPIYFGRVSQINFFGNSITQYQNALPYDSAYDLLIADTLKAYWQNYALSGMGIFYNTSKHDSIISGVNNNAATLTMTGYNDTRAVSINYRTYKKIASGTKAMFLNHFANYYLPASTTPSDTSITRYGTWTVGQNATQWSGKTKNAAYTSTLNDSIVWKSQPATSIGINLIAGDSTTYNHSIVELFIDGVSQGQFNTNNIADDAAAVGSGDTRISYPIIVGGLTSACHTVKLVNKANRIMYVDYFSTLDQKKPAFVIFHLINPLPIQDTANIALDSMVATLPSGFPVLVVKTENFWNKVTGMSGDGIHPNNLGHHQIYMAFRSVYDSVVNSQGTLAFDGRNLWISGGGSMQKILNASDAWTKGDAAINVAGYINLPYNMSIKQNGTDILKTSEDNQSTFVGYKAGYLQTTALGNTGIGYKSLFSLTTGNANTGIGQLSLASVTSGIQNTAIGYQAAFNYMGDGTVAIGLQALFSNTTGMHNTAIGKGALFGNTGGSDNTALGFNTLSAGASGDENTVIGYNAMPVLTGSGNSVLGVHALETTTTGSYNSAIGRYAMAQNTTGTGNVAIGNGALYGASAGGSNYCVALGYGSLGNITGGANGNIGIGYQAGNNISSGTNNIIIGYNVSAPLATGNNQLNIGNVIFGSGLTGTGTLIAGSIGIGLNTPSARLHLPGGTSVANTAPFKIDSGIVLSSPEKGAIESDGDSLYWTNRSLIRIALNRTNTNLTLQQVLTNGSTLTTTNTIAAGNNIQTLTGTQASSSNYAYSFQNTSGNGGALGATAGGTGASLSGNNSSSGDGVFANSTSGTGMHATSTSGTAGNFRIGPSSTNTTVKVLDITRGTSGTAADGIGGYIDLNATTDAANDDPAVRFVWKFTTAADATRRGQFEIWQATTTSMSRFLTITGTGQLQLPFYGTGTFTGTPTTIPAFTSGGDVVEKTVSILSHSITTPATGGTVNLVNNQYNIINPSGTIATLTVNLPSSPADNDRVEIKYTQAVTTVTYGNGTVVDGIASPISGQLVVLVYDSSAGKWY